MSILEQLINLTDKKYGIDVSNNLHLEKDVIVFSSDESFDWFEHGVFIYYPKFEGEPGVNYLSKGLSTIYERRHAQNPNTYTDSEIYIRQDYHKMLSQYFKKYQIVDQEEQNTQTKKLYYKYTHFSAVGQVK